MKLLNICGARPNFIKIAPLMEAYRHFPAISPVLVHTGQHYDPNMSDLFFDELEIPRPSINLEVGSAGHAQQTAAIMSRFEPVLIREKPDAVLVVGDVNSTLACSLTAAKMQIPVLHVEAGLRSFDRAMPEEINRIVTDAISSLLFVSEPSGQENLRKEGIDPSRIHFVGNVMIDTLRRHLDKARTSDIHRRLDLRPRQYGLITLHRPGNVDDPAVLGGLVKAFEKIQERTDLVFCVHPRTRKLAEEFGLWSRLQSLPKLRLTDSLGYLDFLFLMAEAGGVLTDSGGIQEETTILRVPCLTIRNNTERPITLTHGTNVLVGADPEALLRAWEQRDDLRRRAVTLPPLWDGQAAPRIAQIINQIFS